MMIVQPKYVTKQLVEEAMQEVKEKRIRPRYRKSASKLRRASGAMMHIGPYAAEEPTITAIHDYIAQNNFERRQAPRDLSQRPRKTRRRSCKQ